MDTEKKRALEAEVMSKMIAIYCRGNKHAGRARTPQDTDELCPDCRRLLDYARDRRGLSTHGGKVLLLRLPRALLQP